MKTERFGRAGWVCAMLLFSVGMSGTEIYKGPVSKELAEQLAWPTGTLELVNDPLRVSWWVPWFSEWPNDVHRFGYQVKSMEEVNGTLKKFGAIAGMKKVELSAGTGEIDPAKNRRVYAMTLAVGSQKMLDAWFKQLPADGKFGTQVYKEAPKALEPTMRLYVGSEVVELSKLEVPEGVKVVSRIEEWERQEGDRKEDIGKIEAYMKRRVEGTGTRPR